MKLLLQAIARAADAALSTCWPVATPPGIGEQWLADMEAEDEVSEPRHACCGGISYWHSIDCEALAEAEDEAWEMNELFTKPTPFDDIVEAWVNDGDKLWQFLQGQIIHAPQTASTDGAVSDPAVECSPAAAGPGSSAAAGHPNISQRRLHAAAAYGMRRWINGETCDAPTYYRSIVRDLEQFTQ